MYFWDCSFWEPWTPVYGKTPFIGRKKCLSGEKTIFRFLSQSLKYKKWRTAPEAKDFERQKNQSVVKTACVLSRSENKWAQTFARVYKNSMFSNYAASNFWGLQPHLFVKIAKTGFDFHNNSFQVKLFSGQHFKYWVSAAFSSKFFGNSRKSALYVCREEIGHNSFFDVSCNFSRIWPESASQIKASKKFRTQKND